MLHRRIRSMCVAAAVVAILLLLTIPSGQDDAFDRDASSDVTNAEQHFGAEQHYGSLERPGVSSTIRFEVVSANESGVDFQYFGSPSDDHYMTEQNGGGVAVFDLDSDGNPDLFFVNGSHFRHSAQSQNASNQLFRGNGAFGFRNVTHDAGMKAYNFGHGCAAGDFNNDGFTDMFVATYGRNSLWHNNGDGTFTDVTTQSGLTHTSFSSSAAFADLDGDGNMDLYVVNYLNWIPDDLPRTRVPSPMDFEGQADLLYQNSGDGLFREIGREAGVAISDDGKGLAVAIADLNGDQKLDIYVANDTCRNFLFQNQGNMTFREVGVATGSAVSQDGAIGSSMGVAVSDYNHDGRPDLFVSNFANEVVDVLSNAGHAGFIATNAELGVDTVSRSVLNFGIVATDFDLDTWPDLFFANGHLWDESAAGLDYFMRPSLLKNERGDRFRDIADHAGAYFREHWLGRATAMGDIDNDGDMDLVVGQLLAPSVLLRNESDRLGESQRIRFIGTASSRQPLGSAVAVQLANGQTLHLTIASGGSFQSAHDTVLVVATGTSVAETITICWPSGDSETWYHPQAEHTICLVEGSGTSH